MKMKKDIILKSVVISIITAIVFNIKRKKSQITAQKLLFMIKWLF